MIALAGMAITLVLNFTLLPALLTLLKPRSAPREMGFPWAAAVDSFLLKHRWPVVGVWALITVAGLALSPRLASTSIRCTSRIRMSSPWRPCWT